MNIEINASTDKFLFVSFNKKIISLCVYASIVSFINFDMIIDDAMDNIII